MTASSVLTALHPQSCTHWERVKTAKPDNGSVMGVTSQGHCWSWRYLSFLAGDLTSAALIEMYYTNKIPLQKKIQKFLIAHMYVALY